MTKFRTKKILLYAMLSTGIHSSVAAYDISINPSGLGLGSLGLAAFYLRHKLLQPSPIETPENKQSYLGAMFNALAVPTLSSALYYAGHSMGQESMLGTAIKASSLFGPAYLLYKYPSLALRAGALGSIGAVTYGATKSPSLTAAASIAGLGALGIESWLYNRRKKYVDAQQVVLEWSKDPRENLSLEQFLNDALEKTKKQLNGQITLKEEAKSKLYTLLHQTIKAAPVLDNAPEDIDELWSKAKQNPDKYFEPLIEKIMAEETGKSIIIQKTITLIKEKRKEAYELDDPIRKTKAKIELYTSVLDQLKTKQLTNDMLKKIINTNISNLEKEVQDTEKKTKESQEKIQPIKEKAKEDGDQDKIKLIDEAFANLEKIIENNKSLIHLMTTKMSNL